MLAVRDFLVERRRACEQFSLDGVHGHPVYASVDDLLRAESVSETKRMLNQLLEGPGLDTGDRYTMKMKLVTSVVSTRHFNPIKDTIKHKCSLTLFKSGRVLVTRDLTTSETKLETWRGSVLDAQTEPTLVVTWVSKDLLSAFERLGAEGVGLI